MHCPALNAPAVLATQLDLMLRGLLSAVTPELSKESKKR